MDALIGILVFFISILVVLSFVLYFVIRDIKNTIYENNQTTQNEINKINTKMKTDYETLTNNIINNQETTSKTIEDNKQFLIEKHNESKDELNEKIDLNIQEQNQKRENLSETLNTSIDNLNSQIEENYSTQKDLIDKLNLKLDENMNIQTEKTEHLKDNFTSSISSLQQELYSLIENNSLQQKELHDELKNELDKNKVENIEHIKGILDKLSVLSEEYLDLKDKVYFFAQIKEDSKKLNDISMTQEGIKKEKELLDSILAELSGTIVERSEKKTEQPITTKVENLIETNIQEPESIIESADDNLVVEPDLVEINSNLETEPVTQNDFELQQNVVEGKLIFKLEKPVIEPKIEYKKENKNDIKDAIVLNGIDEQSVASDINEGIIPSIFDEDQKLAYKNLAYSNDNLFITGRAGTGKSLLLSVFSRATDKKILILAPTGIAALNVGGATVHSAFGFHNLVNLALEDITKNSIKLSMSKQLVLKNVDTIIIDEISMLRSDVLEKINKILQCLNETDEIFGGKQMIFIGDLFQLPPVVRNQEVLFLDEKYGGEYFFLAPSYKKANFHLIELTYNHRQDSDPEFFNILNNIREGNLRKNDIDKLNTRVVDRNDKSLRRVLRLFATKNEVDETNNEVLEDIFGKEFIFEAEIEYNKYNSRNVNIDSNFPFPQFLKLKVGANVMFVSNDRSKRWVNGKMGIVSAISEDLIKVDVEGVTVDVERVSFSQKEANYRNGKISYEDVLQVKQFPLTLAYAITIHKSQGMTYPQIAVDISNCFDYGQEYVALSRTISLDGLNLLEPIALDSINISPLVHDFYSNCISNNKILNRKNNNHLS